MLAQVLQIFLGLEYLVKNWLISTLDKVIYFKGTIFSLLHKIGWRSAENDIFFLLCFFYVVYLAPKISMEKIGLDVTEFRETVGWRTKRRMLCVHFLSAKNLL
jgi:hypothetical protein